MFDGKVLLREDSLIFGGKVFIEGGFLNIWGQGLIEGRFIINIINSPILILNINQKQMENICGIDSCLVSSWPGH